MPRLLLALPLAALLFMAAPSPAYADSAGAHAAAARKAQKANKWSKALEEWQAAYRIEPNADYLVGMGDAYAKLGDKANAKKQYEAYMADPLALDADSVKVKIAALDKKSDDLSLDMGGPTPASTGGLDFDTPAAAPEKKKGKKGKSSGGDLSLDLGGPSSGGDLDLPSSPPPKKVASNDLSLDLGPPPAAKPAAKPSGGDLSLDLGPPPAAKPAKSTTPAKPADTLALDAIAARPPTNSAPPPAKIAVTAPPPTHLTSAPPPPTHAAPTVAVTTTTEPKVVEHNNRIIAYTTAGLAVGALAVGGLYYTKASQDHSDLASNTIRTGAQQQSLISDEKTNKSLSLAGLAAGLVLAGVTAAIFVF